MSDEKISETLEFLTQIHTAWDNSEQRAALRTRPRRSISYDYIGTESRQSQYLRSLVYNQQTQIFQIPMWHAAYQVTGQFYEGNARLEMPVETLWQYRGCSGALIWLNDDYGGTYFPISALSVAGIIALGKQIEKDWQDGTGIIAPVAWGCLSQLERYSNFIGSGTSLNITVEVIKEAEAPLFPSALSDRYEPEDKLYGTNLPAIYLGYELFMKPPTWASDMSANFGRNANRLDNKTGIFSYDLKSKEPVESRQIEYIMTSRAEINNMQRFFVNKKGRLHSFYAPTWLNDIEPVYDCPAGAMNIITKYSMYWRYFANAKNRNKAIVFYKDTTAEIIEIAGYSTDETGDYGRVMLVSPLRRSINIKDVSLISYLCRYRLDSDTMVIDYDTVSIASTSFSFVEVAQ